MAITTTSCQHSPSWARGGPLDGRWGQGKAGIVVPRTVMQHGYTVLRYDTAATDAKVGPGMVDTTAGFDTNIPSEWYSPSCHPSFKPLPPSFSLLPPGSPLAPPWLTPSPQGVLAEAQAGKPSLREGGPPGAPHLLYHLLSHLLLLFLHLLHLLHLIHPHPRAWPWPS